MCVRTHSPAQPSITPTDTNSYDSPDTLGAYGYALYSN